MRDQFSNAQQFRKPAAVSQGGIVVAQSRKAAEVGAEVLAAGGDCVDAVVAISFALGVLEPWMSGIGGGGAMVLYRAREGRYEVIDFGMLAPGTSVKLSIVRKGEANTVSLTLGQSPGQRQANADTDQQATPNDGTPRLGLGDVGGAGNQGVAVTAVDPNGPAAAQGIKTGDVILGIAGKTVSSPCWKT